MFRSNRVAAAALALALVSLPASAITAVQTVERMVTETLEDGSVKVSYVEADRIQPGEEVIYRLSYENNLETAAGNVALVMPVPQEVRYIEGSAVEPGTAVSFSVDGGETFAAMNELSVETAGRIRSAAASDVTHIRWTFEQEIAAGAKGDILFKAILR
ncbi:MAG: hypothetical protein AAFX02_05880 [Pseudomonadota bacterium]